RAPFVVSSRRRHTRSKRDWSSDVCSSDLTLALSVCCEWLLKVALPGDGVSVWFSSACAMLLPHANASEPQKAHTGVLAILWHSEIGRASCRDRVEVEGGRKEISTEVELGG